MIKISIIIPTYKPKSYLQECLESLAKQTFAKKDFEIILVLNGCNEPYKKNIEQYIGNNMNGINLTFIHTKEGGVSNARNIALEQAKGEYITFVDDDDIVSTDYLKELYKAASPSTISLSRTISFKDGEYKDTDKTIDPIYNKLYQQKTIKLNKARKYFSGPCMKLIPINFIQGRKYDTRFKNGEDSIFMFLISDKIRAINVASPNAIYYRRIRKGSATTSNRTKLEILINNLRVIGAYSQIYFKKPQNYNFLFFTTRILAAIHSTIVGIKNSILL